jgi:hypothetical protein
VKDIDSRIFQSFETFADPEKFTADDREDFMNDIQSIQDAVVAENLSEALKELDELWLTIRSLTEELSSTKKQLEISSDALIEQTAILYQEVPRRITRIIQRFTKRPTGAERYENTKREAVHEVLAEMKRQGTKWGPMRQMENGTGSDYWKSMRDGAQQATDAAFKYGWGNWSYILLEEVYEVMAESNPKRLKAELIQVAAVALSWWVSLKLQRTKK